MGTTVGVVLGVFVFTGKLVAVKGFVSWSPLALALFLVRYERSKLLLVLDKSRPLKPSAVSLWSNTCSAGVETPL